MKPLPISPNGPPPLSELGAGMRARSKIAGGGFKETFTRYLSEVNVLQHQADKAVRDLATGKMDSLHQLVAAINEADLSFRLMMEMRNKLVEAYKEIMRMQV